VTPHGRYVLRLADTNLGLANVSLDLLGQARLLLAHAGQLEGRGRDEDALAFLREESEFYNLTLVEQPNGDFGDTIVRQFLFDAWQLGMYEALRASTDATLAAVAAQGRGEAAYHLRYSEGWLVRLGDGTPESHARVADSLARRWPLTRELFDDDDVDRAAAEAGIGVLPSTLEPAFAARVDRTLGEATLERPGEAWFDWYGKQGRHSEHLGDLLAEMQSLHRAHPGATW
jgi:ring-1,2-phenylacetyl-CoA epoxidase subunit PaaC